MYVTLVSVKMSFTCQMILVWIILLLAVPEFCQCNKSQKSVPPNCLKLLQDNINQVSSASSVQNNGFIIHEISDVFLIHYKTLFNIYIWIYFLYKQRMFSAPCFRPTAVIIWLHSLPPWYLAAAVEVPDTFQHADPSNGCMLCSLPSPCPLYTFLSVPQTRSENFFPHFLHFLTLLCTMNHVHLKACLFTGTPGEEQKAGLPYRHLYTAVEIKILINHIISHLIWLVGPS